MEPEATPNKADFTHLLAVAARCLPAVRFGGLDPRKCIWPLTAANDGVDERDLRDLIVLLCEAEKQGETTP